MNNKESAVASGRVLFALANAERYTVPETVDRIYFFNPFFAGTAEKVIARILNSYYENRRTVKLFFYYPSDEYISYLMTVDKLMFYDEISCQDLFNGNDPRERIILFQVSL